MKVGDIYFRRSLSGSEYWEVSRLSPSSVWITHLKWAPPSMPGVMYRTSTVRRHKRGHVGKYIIRSQTILVRYEQGLCSGPIAVQNEGEQP